MKDFTFVFNIEPYIYTYPNESIEGKDSQKMCLMLCNSIRALGITSTILAISANGKIPSEETFAEFKALGVEFDNAVIDERPYNGYFNKVNAYTYLSKKIQTKYVCFLDIDILFLQVPNFDSIKDLLRTFDIVSALGYEPQPHIMDGALVDTRVRHFPSKEASEYMAQNYSIGEEILHTGTIFLKNDLKLRNIMDNWSIKSSIITKDQNVTKYYPESVFCMNVLTDEDTLSCVLSDKDIKAATIQLPEIVHYHSFQNLPLAFKEIEASDHIKQTLIRYNSPYLL